MALLTSLAMTFGPGLLNWYLNRDLSEQQKGALDAQQMLAAVQSQMLQNRAGMEEPFRAGLLNSLSGVIDQPQTRALPGQMSVVNPFLNLNRARRGADGGYSYEQALPGAKRQFISPDTFETETTPGPGLGANIMDALGASQQVGFGGGGGDMTGGLDATGQEAIDQLNDGAVDISREGGPLDYSGLNDISDEEEDKWVKDNPPLSDDTMHKLMTERGYVKGPDGKYTKGGA